MHPLATHVADLRDPAAVRAAVAGADLAIGAVPGFMGFATLRAVIEAGVNAVDISFFDEDPFELDALAQAKGVTVVTDAGVAPGLSNLVLGYEAAAMVVDSFRCLVGGLPMRRGWPWQYKAPFSPVDVLEEYTRPARLVEHGAMVVKPALSEPELVEIDPVGTLEAFNTDGLRTLLRTMHVPHMAEKTLRYPGHIEYMRVLGESGFLSTEPVQVGGRSVRPIDMTATLLFPRWRLAPGEPEFTAMEMTIRGARGWAAVARSSIACSTAPMLRASRRWRAPRATPAQPSPGWCWTAHLPAPAFARPNSSAPHPAASSGWWRIWPARGELTDGALIGPVLGGPSTSTGPWLSC